MTYAGWADPDRPQRAGDADRSDLTVWLRAADEGIKVEFVKDAHADPRASVCPVCGCGPFTPGKGHVPPGSATVPLSGTVRGWPAHPDCALLAGTLAPRPPAPVARPRRRLRLTAYRVVVAVLLVFMVAAGHPAQAAALAVLAVLGITLRNGLTRAVPVPREPPPPAGRGAASPRRARHSWVNAQHTDYRDRRPIASLKCGESGWAVPWALERAPNGTLWLCPGFTVHHHSGGTAQLRVKRDIGGLWAVEGPLPGTLDTTTPRLDAERVVSATDTRREDTR